ncbi:hypothetical protein GYMLUDRAFT_516783 [Collybiopsis luxurians FD-317 M1]|nr:hypothetical protein GYMLUDRAFT_516783 [Collybiopsis luxurians FD-317 M1]
MDVMMSMRAQGIITSPAVSASHTSPTRSTFSAQELSFPGDGYPISSTTINSHSGHDAASMSSAKSSKNGRPSSPYKHASTGGAVLSLKGLFASSRSSVGHHSGRPRSASKTSRFDEMEDHSSSIRGGAEPTDSSVSVTKSILPKGNNLISILRASSPPLEGSSFGSILPGANSNMGIHAPAVDFAAIGINRPPLQTPQNQLDRKILRAPLDHDGERRKNDRTSEARSLLFSQDPVVDDTSGSSSPGTRTIRTYSASESFSLQPPPRKRWTSTSEINPSLVLDAPQSQTLQLQESPYIRDHRNLDDIDVLGGAPSIGRINTARNGSLTPEPISNGSPHTKRASGQSAYSFSFGTPPGSGNIDTEYRRRSLSSRSVRSGQSGRSVDTAEEEVEELDIPAGGSEGPLSGRTRRPSEGSGLGPYDGDKRASNSSGKRNSVGIASGKRWSRQLPKRLTPPSGPPPATPVTPPPNFPTSSAVKSLPKTPQSHPYSGAATERRASTLTTHSTSSSHSSAMSNLPNFSKRASVSSAVSALSANSTQTPGTTTAGNQTPVSGNGSHSRASSSHRSSLAPPPRPAPTFALPPAPDGETAPSLVPPPQMSAPLPSSHNKVFRESIASRAFRLSLMAPKPPPSGVLPPRPDELPPEYPASPTSSVGSRHRRSHSSNNSSGGPGNLYSIPGSPVAPSNMPSADAISRGTLPSAAATAAPSSTPSRGASIKQRLRILSAPAPASSPPIPPRSSARPTPSSSSPPGTPSLMNGSTPYLEKQGHDSSSFHALGTPTTPSIPIPKVHNFEDELDAEPEIPSLPPPPRRGSKRISLPEVEAPANQDGEANNATRRTSIEDANFNDTDKPLFSLSHPGSAISLGVVDA